MFASALSSCCFKYAWRSAGTWRQYQLLRFEGWLAVGIQFTNLCLTPQPLWHLLNEQYNMYNLNETKSRPLRPFEVDTGWIKIFFGSGWGRPQALKHTKTISWRMTRCGRIYPIHSDTCLSWQLYCDSVFSNLFQLEVSHNPDLMQESQQMSTKKSTNSKLPNELAPPHGRLGSGRQQKDAYFLGIRLPLAGHPLHPWSTDSAVIVTVLWVYSKGTYLRAFNAFNGSTETLRETYLYDSVGVWDCLRIWPRQDLPTTWPRAP